MVRAYIGLGSNLDDPPAQLRRALRALGALPKTRLLGRSGLYRSKPLALPDGSALEQPDYVNAVAVLETGLLPEELLGHLQGIESAQGRLRDGPRWGPRTLDLDVLLFGDLQSGDPRLTLPHPGLAARAFVLHPLSECAPGLRLPDGRKLRDLLAACPADGIERIGP